LTSSYSESQHTFDKQDGHSNTGIICTFTKHVVFFHYDFKKEAGGFVCMFKSKQFFMKS